MRLYFLMLLMIFTSSKLKAQEAFVRGEVIDSVFCGNGEHQSYALYLPSNYNVAQSWPVIILLEPMARGAFSVKQFVLAAEKYGYIIAGSNNSRNGPYQNNYDAFEYLLEDVQSKLNIHHSRVYVSGFSGGSRTALSIASRFDLITGVIGCGAALPPFDQGWPEKGSNFVYVGLVGNRDMNFREMMALKGFLSERAIDNSLMVFDASHQWPPPEVNLKAIEWLQIQAMKMELIAKDEMFLDKVKSDRIEEATHFENQNKLMDAMHIYNSIKMDFMNFIDVASIEKAINRVEELKEYKSQWKKWNRIKEQELQLQKEYEQAAKELTYEHSDLDSLERYWLSEINQLKRLENGDNEFKSQMASRLMNLISAISIEGSNARSQLADYSGAQALIKLGIKLRPSNSFFYYRLAVVESLGGKENEAIKSLEKSIELGLNNKKWLNIDAFNSIRNTEKFKRIVEGID